MVRDLMFKGKKYYGDFLESHEKISTNILAERLQRLEAHGVINKVKDQEHKSKFIYSLTEKGKALLPIMLEITQWSSTYDSLTNTPKEFSEALKVDKDSVMGEVLKGLTPS